MTVAIAFANQKGGVGKSTLTCQFAYYLALRKSKRVLVVDMDGQGSATETLLEDEEFNGTKTEELFDENFSDEIRIQRNSHGVEFIGTVPSEDSYDVDSLPLEQIFNINKQLKPLFDNYDYVLIDCPPTLSRRLVASLVMANYVITPIKLSGYAVSGFLLLNETIDKIRRRANRRLKLLGVAINLYDENAAQRDALNAVREALGDVVFKSVIRNRSPIDLASVGLPITAVRNNGKANEELSELFEEFLDRINSPNRK